MNHVVNCRGGSYIKKRTRSCRTPTKILLISFFRIFWWRAAVQLQYASDVLHRYAAGSSLSPLTTSFDANRSNSPTGEGAPSLLSVKGEWRNGSAFSFRVVISLLCASRMKKPSAESHGACKGAF